MTLNKILYFILFSLALCNGLWAQNTNQKPQYPGGNQAMMQYLDGAIKYPEEAKKKGIQGTVTVKVIIDIDGTVKLPRVMGSVHPLLDAEAIRVVKNMPKWVPGKQNGSKVAMSTTIQINFNKPQSDFEQFAGATEIRAVDEIENKLDSGLYTMVEEMPQYKGKEYLAAIREFAEKNMKYPEKALQEKIEGRVYLQFTVDKKGKIKDISIIRGVNPLLDEEALRIIKLMKKWKPGRQAKKVVDVRLTGLINFKLEDRSK